jgi:chitinase
LRTTAIPILFKAIHFCYLVLLSEVISALTIAHIKKCQEAGKIILLSMGGATGAPFFNSEEAGSDYADTLWNMFGAGSKSGVPRPFGDAVVDGFDFDIEAGSSVGLTGMAKRLRVLYDTDPKKIYYISGAPQCPFPDAHLGPSGANKNYVMRDSWFDFAFVQFYNNYCHFGGSNFNFETWNTWAQEGKTQIFLGVPGDSYAASWGYQPASKVIEVLGNLVKSFGPQNGGWLGGYMTWDVGSSEYNTAGGASFASSISAFLKSNSKCSSSTSQTLPSSTSSSIPQIPALPTQSESNPISDSETPQPTSIIPDPNDQRSSCYETVGYWGQNSVGARFADSYEKPLAQYCADSTWDIIIVSFLHIFKNGDPSLPGINFSYHCTNAPDPKYPNILICPEIEKGIKICQERGKKYFSH